MWIRKKKINKLITEQERNNKYQENVRCWKNKKMMDSSFYISLCCSHFAGGLVRWWRGRETSSIDRKCCSGWRFALGARAGPFFRYPTDWRSIDQETCSPLPTSSSSSFILSRLHLSLLFGPSWKFNQDPEAEHKREYCWKGELGFSSARRWRNEFFSGTEPI